MEALTTYFESRYFWIVLTFVGDSTITSDFFATLASPLSPSGRHEPLAIDLAHAAGQLQLEEERGRPPRGHPALFDDVVDRRRFFTKRLVHPSHRLAIAPFARPGHVVRGRLRYRARPDTGLPAQGQLRHHVVPALHERGAILDQSV